VPISYSDYGFRCLILIWECFKQIECTIIMDEVSVCSHSMRSLKTLGKRSEHQKVIHHALASSERRIGLPEWMDINS